MPLSTSEVLARLGSGQSIEGICSSAGWSREEFDTWWRCECQARVPATTGTRRAGVLAEVRIERDEWGIPHVFATGDDDLFFGFGYAVAQDRLFQLDYLRRRALGRLAEVLGPEGLELDLVARTVGLHRIAQAEWQSLPDETRRLLEAYTRGINGHIDECRDNLPIEFDLLGYAPESWRPQDSLAIMGEFRWYLTGRFPIIVVPELAKHVLGDGALYRAFLQSEADAEPILPAGAYPPSRSGTQLVGATVNDLHEGAGSNNWVVSGARSLSGKPLLASDPHIAFAAVSCWHEVRLCGGSFNVAGTAYAGMPAVMFGRNERVAFGITNNICSQRDLYQERTDPAHPGCFLYDGQWEPSRQVEETIAVKGEGSVRKTIRFSRNGPIVDEILPVPARETGPVALKWLGAARCGWLTALLGVDRARSGEELRRAVDCWLVPTFSLVYIDVDGHIGYQATGRVPIRDVEERGYRPGWEPAHQWNGLIPFEGMPHWEDPPRGWLATANNRVAAEDFPYPLTGRWACGYRAIRVRQMLEARPKFCRDDFARMQQDSVSLRAAACVPALLAVLQRALDCDAKPQACGTLEVTAGESGGGEMRSSLHALRTAVEYLAAWDFRMEPDRVAAAIFNVFFLRWCQRVADERFTGETSVLLAGAVAGLATELLSEDKSGWFAAEAADSALVREAAIVQTFLATLEALSEKLGPDPIGWAWGRLHTLEQKHVLTGRGDLGLLLDRGGRPVRGDSVTVCNTGQTGDTALPMGAGYRLLVDLADPHGGLWAIDAGSESGHPGSPHYDDQVEEWLTARYHRLTVARGDLPTAARHTRILQP